MINLCIVCYQKKLIGQTLIYSHQLLSDKNVPILKLFVHKGTVKMCIKPVQRVKSHTHRDRQTHEWVSIWSSRRSIGGSRGVWRRGWGTRSFSVESLSYEWLIKLVYLQEPAMNHLPMCAQMQCAYNGNMGQVRNRSCQWRAVLTNSGEGASQT